MVLYIYRQDKYRWIITNWINSENDCLITWFPIRRYGKDCNLLSFELNQFKWMNRIYITCYNPKFNIHILKVDIDFFIICLKDLNTERSSSHLTYGLSPVQNWYHIWYRILKKVIPGITSDRWQVWVIHTNPLIHYTNT